VYGGPYRFRPPVHDDDVIDGGRGNDVITGGYGDDIVDGSSGSDFIEVADTGINANPLIPLGRGDTTKCGGDIDQVVADYYDHVALDCDELRPGTPAWPSVKPGRGGGLTFKLRCAWDTAHTCRGDARLVGWRPGEERRSISLPQWPDLVPPAECTAAPGAVLAAGRFEIRAGRVNRATIELTPQGRRLLARRRCTAAHLVLRYHEPGAGPREMTRRLTVRRR
jgi:hypothetical protein